MGTHVNASMAYFIMDKFANNAVLRIVNNVLYRYVQNVIMGLYCLIIINGQILA